MYVELVERGITNRGNIVECGSIKPVPRDFECYISLFPYDKTIVDYVKINKTVKNHAGKHACDYIVWDIDNDGNLQKSKDDALWLLNYWQSEYGLSPDDTWIYFSGYKGFHIILTSKTFGQLEMSAEMGESIKRAAIELAGTLQIDVKIYENHRIVRVANSRHLKSGLYKIELTYDELFSMSILDIQELAKSPRILDRKKQYRDVLKNDLIARIVQSSFLIKENKEVIETGFFLPDNKGNRNNKLFAQACTLFQNTQLHEKSIKEIITSINLASGDPLPAHEINTLVNSARTKRKGKEDETLQITTFDKMWEQYISGFINETEKLSLVFPSVDLILNGKVRSKVGVILGYGGAKKSMYGQNICYRNLSRGYRTIYSNMEMGLNDLTARFINIAMQGFDNHMASYHIEEAFYRKENLTRFLDSIKDLYNDRLLVAENSNMTAEKYDVIIDQVTRERGKVDILIVDGMSMMGGAGTEVERANEHSKQLKELAKKWNIFVAPIVHVSRGEELTVRDLTRRARGSEKIADNADFFITFSQIATGIDCYRPDAGVYHLWDKRGSGRRVEKGWRFENDMLQMIEDNEVIKQNGTREADF
jgi:KaiC/GvpD/RAD55 family RecA-like ATPase